MSRSDRRTEERPLPVEVRELSADHRFEVGQLSPVLLEDARRTMRGRIARAIRQFAETEGVTLLTEPTIGQQVQHKRDERGIAEEQWRARAAALPGRWQVTAIDPTPEAVASWLGSLDNPSLWDQAGMRLALIASQSDFTADPASSFDETGRLKLLVRAGNLALEIQRSDLIPQGTAFACERV
jgi:hypothetical protein